MFSGLYYGGPEYKPCLSYWKGLIMQIALLLALVGVSLCCRPPSASAHLIGGVESLRIPEADDHELGGGEARFSAQMRASAKGHLVNNESDGSVRGSFQRHFPHDLRHVPHDLPFGS